MTWTVADGSDNHINSRAFIQYGGSAPSPANCISFATVWRQLWVDYIAPLSHPDVNFQQAECQDLSSAMANSGIFPGADPGSRSGGLLPAGVAANLAFHIGRKYRGGKPRMYLPIGTDSDLATPQTWTGPFQTAIAAAWGNVLAGFLGVTEGGTTTSQQVSVSLYQGFNSYRPTPTSRYKNASTYRAVAQVDPVTSYLPSITISSQRRRYRAT